MSSTPFDVSDTISQLAALETQPDLVAPGTIDLARQWSEALTQEQHFLDKTDYKFVFVGNVGVGKSSLIGVAAKLLIGASPTDRTSLKNNSVLAIGSGRTTICEVQITQSPGGSFGLTVEPYSREELERELRFFAEDEWYRVRPILRRSEDDDFAVIPLEIQRALKGITGYTEYQETYSDGRIRKRRTVRPLESAALAANSAEQFASELIDRAMLSARTRTVWEWQGELNTTHSQLKAQFEAINQGTDPSAMLPRRMFLQVPSVLPSSSLAYSFTLIDTRGLDGTIESRRDLQTYFRDERTIIVLCSSFNDAPSDMLRGLLKTMGSDAELRRALSKTLLVLIDQGDSEQVNGADGDREYGQELKISECLLALESGGGPWLQPEQLLAFDVLRDERERLISALDSVVNNIRHAAEARLARHLEDSHAFLASAGDVLQVTYREAVDSALKEALSANFDSEPPLRDPLAGIYDAIRKSRYASVVYATCRRRGYYAGLDLYAAVEAEASRAATARLEPLMSAVKQRLDQLENSDSYLAVLDYIRLRRLQFANAQIRAIRSYAERVSSEIESQLSRDSVWELCCLEWGAGDGFKEKVLALLEAWQNKQSKISAHQDIGFLNEIPLMSEVSKPIQAPRFTLKVRNLRGLRNVSWSPERVSLLIGANGAGKTSLLLTLKLLKVAYEKGLAEAVSSVMQGSSNLRSWGAPENEPVIVTLDVGGAIWTVELSQRDGTVDYLTQEILEFKGNVIFRRDSLGAFIYQGERLEPTVKLGLRALIDKGAADVPVRAVATFLQHISTFYDPDIWSIRQNGSNALDAHHLHSRSGNALAVLRRWSQQRHNRRRYDFVLEGLRAAFPGNVEDLDFEQAGNTLVGRIYSRGSDIPQSLQTEANGIIQMLVLLCNVVSADDQSVVTIDEPENCLHPYAVRVFLEFASSWARQHNLTLILATHSIVLLDELTGHSDQIYVMKSASSDRQLPERLDQAYDPVWLSNFKLGQLYEEGEIGSNEDNT